MDKRKEYFNQSLKPDEVIPASYDKIFKLIFGDIDHLERINMFLSVTLKKEVKVISFVNPELMEDNRLDKVNSVDLVCEVEGELVSVEVNTSFGSTVINRNLAFLFRMVSKDLKPGDEYKKLRKYYQINVNTVDYNGQHFEVYQLRGENSNKLYSNMITIININVSYYAKMCYNSIIKGDMMSLQENFYAMVGTDNKNVLKKIMEKNEVLKGIGQMIERFSSDDDIVFKYNRDKLMMDDFKEVVTEEVTKQVTKEVTKNVKEEIASNLLKLNTPIEDIAASTGLTEKQILSLKK